MNFVFKDILKIVPELGTLELYKLLSEIKKEFIKRGKIIGERMGEKEMKNKILLLMFGILFVSFASAETIIAGNNYTFQVDTIESLSWDVVGNSSNMEGFEIYQDIYESSSNITFVIDYRMKPDNFTIILSLNETKEIVKEVPVYNGGYSHRTKIVNNTVIKEVPNYISVPNNTIEYVQNKTIEIKEIPTPTKWTWVLAGGFLLALAILFYLAWKLSEKRHSIENKNIDERRLKNGK